jgi:DNA-binding MarR family transcriptional regulator
MASVPASARDCRPTARLLALALHSANERHLSGAELAERTGTPRGTVNNAVAELVDAGAVERVRNPMIGRRTLYALAEPDVPPTQLVGEVCPR